MIQVEIGLDPICGFLEVYTLLAKNIHQLHEHGIKHMYQIYDIISRG